MAHHTQLAGSRMATSTSSSKKRNYLTLQKRVEVIKEFGKNPGMNHRVLAEMFNCGKTQIGQILKQKESILSLYQSNRSAKRKKMSRASAFEDVNKAVFEWYSMACSKSIFPGGPQVAEKAKQIAEKLGKSDFKGSNGWLTKWKGRYNIKKFRVCGESGDVRGETVESWKERLPELMQGYSAEDIWNMDETGVFWRALPESGFGQKGRECKGGKKCKQRITVAFFVSAAGVKEKPIVIWKSENPRCMKRFEKSVLPVNYYSQKKSWMTGDLMETILTKLNRRLSLKKRSIILLLDNAGCHPESLQSKFSNIKLCFLPANTTSKLQPLDLGIIQNFKVHYRNFLLKYVIAKIDESDNASEVVKSINILIAIRWVAQAWAKVNTETIRKCFRKAGVLSSNMDVVSCDMEGDDPFCDLDNDTPLQELIDRALPANTVPACTAEEYLNGDDDIPVCVDMDDSQWDENFMRQFDKLGEEREEEDDDDDDEEYEILEPETPSIKTFKAAITSLEEVQKFLEWRGHLESVNKIGCIVDGLASLQTQSLTQHTLLDFLSPQ